MFVGVIAVDAHVAQFVEGRELRLILACHLVNVARPVFRGFLAVRELFTNTHTFGDLRGHLDRAASFIQRVDSLFDHNFVGELTGVFAGNQIPSFSSGGIRQHQVAQFHRRCHLVIHPDDELALGVIVKDFPRAIDVAVLRGEHVGAVHHHELNADIELVLAVHTIFESRHLRSVVNRVGPLVAADRRFHRVRPVVKPLGQWPVITVTPAGTAAGNTDVAGHAGQQINRVRLVFTIGVALRTPPLVDVDGRGSGHLTCKLADGVGRDPRNLCGPLRSLFNPVFAFAFHIRTVGGVLRGALGHVLFVEPDAVLVEESLVVQVFGQHDVHHCSDEGGVGSGTDRDPLIRNQGGCIGVARINHDDLHASFLRTRCRVGDAAA